MRISIPHEKYAKNRKRGKDMSLHMSRIIIHTKGMQKNQESEAN
jgi:hypothetical protein